MNNIAVLTNINDKTIYVHIYRYIYIVYIKNTGFIVN